MPCMGVDHWALTVFVLIGINICFGYNIDLVTPDIRSGASGSYFGYSVALHEKADFSWHYIVGAPRAANEQGKLTYPGQRAGDRTGGLFVCSVDDPGCMELDYPPDTSRAFAKTRVETEYAPGPVEEVLNDSWIGVSVSSSGRTGYVLGCAHRYAVSAPSQLYGLGGCFVYDNALNVVNTFDSRGFLSPCYDRLQSFKNPYDDYGLCQAGYSVSTAGQDIVVGLPGANVWAGEAPVLSIRQSLTDVKKNLFFEKSFSADFSQLGASTAVAQRLIPGHEEAYVYGAPMANQTGQVFVGVPSTGGLVPNVTLVGHEPGARFGQQVVAQFLVKPTSLRVGEPSRPAVIVSAPFYSAYDDPERAARHTTGGAVFVYLTDEDTGALPTEPTWAVLGPLHADGSRLTREECDATACHAAQFGTAVSTAGDLDFDGFTELAVGAPYEEGGGAVYVFYGAADGWSTSRMQKVRPSDLVGGEGLQGFGVSLAGGMNVDDLAGYDDILVGSYLSDKVVLLRSRPTMAFDVKYRDDYHSVITPDEVSDACSFNSSLPPKCFGYTMCIEFKANKVSFPSTITYTVVADAEQATSRVELVTSGDTRLSKFTRTLTIVDRDARHCEQITGYLTDRARNYVSPIVMRLTELRPDNPPPTDAFSIKNYPALVPNQTYPRDFQVTFKRDCFFPDCDTDLVVELRLLNPEIYKDSEDGVYTFDSQGEDLEVRLEVTLHVADIISHSPAFETSVTVNLPDELEYLRCGLEDDCTKVVNANRVIWQLADPGMVPKDTNVSNVFTLSSRRLGATPQTINVSATTSSLEVQPDNNWQAVQIKEAIKTELVLSGSHEPRQTFYSGEVKGVSSMQSEDDVGNIVRHRYAVDNRGPGRVSQVTVEITWPHTVEGKYLLYLVSNPIEGAVCDVPVDYINPANLAIPREASLLLQTPTVRKRRQSDSSTASPPAPEGGRVGDTRTGQSGSEPTRSGTVVILDCAKPTVECFSFNCTLDTLDVGTVKRVTVRARVFNSTLVSLYGKAVDLVRIYSSARLFVDPSLNIEQTNTDNDYASVPTDAQPLIESAQKPGTPWWVIFLAITGGIFLLIVVIVVLWKCGFFKRNRPMYHEVQVEKQKKAQQGTQAVPAKYEQVPLKESAFD